MAERTELDDIVRLSGGHELTTQQAKSLELPEAHNGQPFTRFYVVRAPCFTYYFGMLSNLDCFRIRTQKEFNGW